MTNILLDTKDCLERLKSSTQRASLINELLYQHSIILTFAVTIRDDCPSNSQYVLANILVESLVLIIEQPHHVVRRCEIQSAVPCPE